MNGINIVLIKFDGLSKGQKRRLRHAYPVFLDIYVIGPGQE